MTNATVRKLFPKWIKRPLKRALLRRQLRAAIEKMRKLSDGEVPSRQLLSELITAWSNEGYAANLDYLEEVATRAVSTKGPILECGSGVTTILLGILSAQRKAEVWSLEHFPEWRTRVTDVLTYNNIKGVRICSSPLVEYGEFVWYDPPFAEMPKVFSLVVCDGPPGATKGGRYGLLPVMGSRLPAGSIILLDDAGRPAEMEMIERWQSESAFETQVVHSEGGKFALMRRREGSSEAGGASI